MTSRLLTAREVAEIVAVSTETVLRYVRRGILPAIRLPGGAVRFREADVDAWLTNQATTNMRSTSHATLRVHE